MGRKILAAFCLLAVTLSADFKFPSKAFAASFLEGGCPPAHVFPAGLTGNHSVSCGTRVIESRGEFTDALNHSDHSNTATYRTFRGDILTFVQVLNSQPPWDAPSFFMSNRLAGSMTYTGMGSNNADDVFLVDVEYFTEYSGHMLKTTFERALATDGVFNFAPSPFTIPNDERFKTLGPAPADRGIFSTSLVVSMRGPGILVLNGFGQIDGAPLPAPEPATWLSLLTGFGLLGAALRRRRAKVRVQIV